TYPTYLTYLTYLASLRSLETCPLFGDQLPLGAGPYVHALVSPGELLFLVVFGESHLRAGNDDSGAAVGLHQTFRRAEQERLRCRGGGAAGVQELLLVVDVSKRIRQEEAIVEDVAK